MSEYGTLPETAQAELERLKAAYAISDAAQGYFDRQGEPLTSVEEMITYLGRAGDVGLALERWRAGFGPYTAVYSIRVIRPAIRQHEICKVTRSLRNAGMQEVSLGEVLAADYRAVTPGEEEGSFKSRPMPPWDIQLFQGIIQSAELQKVNTPGRDSQ